MERPLARWMKLQRKAHGWKVEELSRRMTDAGYQATVGTIRVWESPRGRDPSAENVAGLERIFGAPAPVQSQPADAMDRLIAIMERQTLALESLAQRMAEERDDAPAWADAVVQAVLQSRQLGTRDTERGEPQASDVPRRGRGDRG